MAFHRFTNGIDQWGSFETWQSIDGKDHGGPRVDNANGREDGWFWWACFPGCMPDGDPVGPFKTEQDAIDDANV